MALKTPPVSRDAIGESVFSLPRFQKVTVPPLVGRFFSEMARLLIVPRTSHILLDAFAGIDVKADRVAELLHANPSYEYLFMRHVRALAKREQVLHLESAVVLFGMQNTRNWMVALQLHRQIRGALPDFDAEGKLLSPPAELLKYALKAEDVLSSDRDGYADTAYLAGLHFDLLALIAESVARAGKEQGRAKALHAYMDELYAQGVARAGVATKLAKSLPRLSARKFVFSACVLSDLGKAALAILEPDYLKFVEIVEKTDPPRTVRMEAELERFGTTHATLSSWIVEFAGLLRPIAPALEFHHDPVLLRAQSHGHGHGHGHGMYELAALVSLSTVIAADPRKPTVEGDPIVAQWLSPDVSDLGIPLAALVAAKA